MIDRAKKLPARFYENSAGRKPVREWVLELPEADRRIVGKDIQKVECPQQPRQQPDRAGDFLHGRRPHDPSAWLYQKDAEDAAAGHRSGAATQTRGDMMTTNGKARVSEETFDEFLAGQGLLEVCEDQAIKEIIATQLAEAMKAQGLTKSAMAQRMKTSRRQLDRLLDPATPSVTLDTLRRAANAVGRTLRVELA
jgi:antitoxin HicB